MGGFVPKKMFFTRGVGTHKHRLRSFELALRDAGIEKANLVRVSSILPPSCEIISREAGGKLIRPGEIVFCVMAEESSNEPHRLVSASVGCAIPSDPNCYGYLSEHHAYGCDEKEAGDMAEDMAAAMLATTLGIEFDEDRDWDERKQVFHMSGQVIQTQHITQTAIVGRTFSTVIAAAVFLADDV